MKINNCKELGKLIRKQRKSLGYTQVYVSESTGLSTTFISDVENGKPTCELEKTLRLMQLMALDVEVTPRVK